MKKLMAEKIFFVATSLLISTNTASADNVPTVESLSDKSAPTQFVLDDLQSINACIDAAKSGNVNAQLSLGLAYSKLEERSIVLDYFQAAKWLKLAARQKNPVAMYKLGFLYQHGFGLPQDEVAGARLYRAAAELGLPEAKTSLAECYMRGIGVPQNFRQALIWYTEGAKQGDSLAQYRLGCIYMTGNNALPCNQVMAYMLLSMAKSVGQFYSQDAAVKLAFLSTHMRMAEIGEAERKASNPAAALSDALSDQIGYADTTHIQ